MSDPSVPDKQALYGEYLKASAWREKLQRKLAHKSLDIPDGDEEMYVNNSRNGLGWLEIAALGAFGIAGLVAVNAIGQGERPAIQQPEPPAATAPVDSEYEVRFFDASGNPIELPQRK